MPSRGRTIQSTPPSRMETNAGHQTEGKISFQSTPPSRMETLTLYTLNWRIVISIHSTLTDGDHPFIIRLCLFYISIHSTLTDGDSGCRYLKYASSLFQSTPPSRMETKLPGNFMFGRVFQSTPPSRMETFQMGLQMTISVFQSTPPSRMETKKSSRRTKVVAFQSTPPSRMETYAL